MTMTNEELARTSEEQHTENLYKRDHSWRRIAPYLENGQTDPNYQQRCKTDMKHCLVLSLTAMYNGCKYCTKQS